MIYSNITDRYIFIYHDTIFYAIIDSNQCNMADIY